MRTSTDRSEFASPKTNGGGGGLATHCSTTVFIQISTKQAHFFHTERALNSLLPDQSSPGSSPRMTCTCFSHSAKTFPLFFFWHLHTSERLEDQTRNSQVVAETSKACYGSAKPRAGKAAGRNDIGTAVAVVDAKLITGAGRGLSSAGALHQAGALLTQRSSLSVERCCSSHRVDLPHSEETAKAEAGLVGLAEVAGERRCSD